jgi:beta-glucosidase
VIPGIEYAKAGSVAISTEEEIAAAVDLTNHSDITIAILGEDREMSGEAASRSSIELPGNQQKLLEAIAATGKPVVLVVMSGRPLAIPWAAEHIPAIVQTWFPGTEGGHAIADVLFGDVNPSGKLAVTIPRATGQVPIYYSQVRIGRPADAANKYTSKYIDLPLGPLYPFGSGLSYTKFDYDNLTLSAPSMRIDGRITVSADVHNNGGRDGDEIVQLYVSDPVASVARPVKELKGFQRITLRTGETKRVTFTIERKDLQFWGENGLITEPGKFIVWIGPSSATGLEGTFELIANAPLKKTSTQRSH